MAAGIQMKFVGMPRARVVKGCAPTLKAVVVLGSAVEIDLQAHGARNHRDDREGGVALPKGGVERVAERCAQSAQDRRILVP